MTTTTYPRIIESIGSFGISIDRETAHDLEGMIRWRAIADCGLCFGGLVDKDLPDEEFRGIVVKSILEQASQMADFVNECVWAGEQE